jgi:PPOX class probable F420-dependent enzyme
MSAGLGPLKSSKTILLTTYKRDGTAVGTPVSIAFDGGQAFFRSYDKAWKTKRLRRNPHVQAAPSTFRGKPTGSAISARATPLEGEQARIAARALARRHRVLQAILVPAAHRLMRYRTLHYELQPDPGQGAHSRDPMTGPLSASRGWAAGSLLTWGVCSGGVRDVCTSRGWRAAGLARARPPIFVYETEPHRLPFPVVAEVIARLEGDADVWVATASACRPDWMFCAVPPGHFLVPTGETAVLPWTYDRMGRPAASAAAGPRVWRVAPSAVPQPGVPPAFCADS